jgi:hypothetical protein
MSIELPDCEETRAWTQAMLDMIEPSNQAVVSISAFRAERDPLRRVLLLEEAEKNVARVESAVVRIADAADVLIALFSGEETIAALRASVGQMKEQAAQMRNQLVAELPHAGNA